MRMCIINGAMIQLRKRSTEHNLRAHSPSSPNIRAVNKSFSAWRGHCWVCHLFYRVSRPFEWALPYLSLTKLEDVIIIISSSMLQLAPFSFTNIFFIYGNSPLPIPILHAMEEHRDRSHTVFWQTTTGQIIRATNAANWLLQGLRC